MTAVGYRFRAELRARWRSVLALALLAGLAGAATIAAVAGARRTDSAFSRLLTATAAADVLVNPDYGNDSGLDSKAVARLPMVTHAARENGLLVMPLPVRNATDLDSTLALGQVGKAGQTIARQHLVDGRIPDPRNPHDVLVNRLFATRAGVAVGDTFPAAILEQDKIAQRAESGGSFDDFLRAVNSGAFGARVRLRVAGIAKTPEEIVVDEGFEQSELFATPAFVRRYPKADAGFFGIAVQLGNGAADLPAFKRAVQGLPHEGAIEFQTTTVTQAKVDRAVRPQVGALSVFAIVIALTGLLLVGQALARQMFLDSVDHPTLRSLGFGRRQLAALAMLRAAVVAIGAALLAVVLAIAVSPLTPIGVARDADPDLGFFIDVPVVVVGALAVLIAVLALAAIPAWWYTRGAHGGAESRPARTSRLVGWLGRSGAPLTTGTGVRMALEPGRGRTAVPTRTTVVGAALAIMTVVAALTFASSLDHLVSTPRLYGWSWDARVEVSGDTSASTTALAARVTNAYEHSKAVAGLSDTVISRVNLDGVTVTALGIHHLERSVGPTIVEGRAPRSDREIALGVRTLDRIGVDIGDTVRAQPDAGGEVRDLRVVGRVVLPGLGTYPGSDKTALGDGALLTKRELRRLGPDFGPGPFLVSLAPGSTRADLAALVKSDDPTALHVVGLQRPSDIVSYERVRSTPLALAGVLALLAIATVAHALVTGVRRRRRDLALLKTLGFTRRQVSVSVAWQATTFAMLALVIAIPLGIIVGRWAWTMLADDLGTVADPIVPVVAVVAAIPLVLLVANAVAFVPGRIAAGLRPATVLRSE
jgi:putative ABC transport system permease protein